MLQTIPSAEPFLFPGKGAHSRIGVLLIHGFTSTPKEMRGMGEFLNRQGFTMLGIRVAGHATHPEDMIRSSWQDWLLSVEDGCNLLRTCTEGIYLAGLSMGGSLALVFADQPGIRGVIAMCTPYETIKDRRLKYIKVLSKFKPYMHKLSGGPGTGWFGDGWKVHVAYPLYPVRSIGEMNILQMKMRSLLSRVNVPVLLINSRDDNPMIRASMEKIHADLGSTRKHMLWIEGSGHTITEEPKREQVFKAVADFIMEIEQGNSIQEEI